MSTPTLYILGTLFYFGLMAIKLSAESEPTLHHCRGCADVLYARPYVPVFCPACGALNWF